MTDAYVITVVGDSNIGKSSLIARYAAKKFPGHYNIAVPRLVDDQVLGTENSFKIIIRDTMGNDETDSNALVNNLTYPFTDCFLLCYAVNDSKSFNNLYPKWYKIIQKYEYISTIIVGLKCDLYNNNVEHVTESEAILLKSLVKAYDIVICSSVSQQNVDLVFSKAVASCIDRKTI